MHFSDFLHLEWVHKNLPIVFVNWFLSILITLDIDGWVFSKNTSPSPFTSHNFHKYTRAACQWHQIKTNTVCLFNWDFRISMPSSFSRLMILSVWYHLVLNLFRRSSILWWSRCVSIALVHFAPRVWTSIFITPKSATRISNSKLLNQT